MKFNSFNQIKQPLSLLLTILFVIYLSFLLVNYNSDKSNILGDQWVEKKVWHYDNSTVVYNKIVNYTTDKQQFKSYKLNKKDIVFFNSDDNNDCLSNDTIINENYSEMDTINNIINIQNNDSATNNIKGETEAKKNIKKINKKDKPSKIQVNKVEINEENKQVKIQDDVEILNTSKVIDTLNADITKQEVDGTNITKENIDNKNIPIKPKIKDYKNSSEYQKALREYYKLIE